jgi:hypothetical protein
MSSVLQTEKEGYIISDMYIIRKCFCAATSNTGELSCVVTIQVLTAVSLKMIAFWDIACVASLK